MLHQLPTHFRMEEKCDGIIDIEISYICCYVQLYASLTSFRDGPRHMEWTRKTSE